MQPYRIINYIVLADATFCMFLWVIWRILQDKDPCSRAARVIGTMAAVLSSLPGIVILCAIAPIEVLIGTPFMLTALYTSWVAVFASTRTTEESAANFKVAIVVSLGWALLSFIGSISSVDAACVYSGSSSTCRASQGVPFQVGASQYVIDNSLFLSFGAGSSNNANIQWTASQGDSVKGTFTCFDGVNLPDKGNVFTDSYQVSTQMVGTFTGGYVPEETCQGSGIGIGLGVTAALPLCPALGVTASVVETWVTVDCPARRLAVANVPIWGSTRVLVESLSQHSVFTDLVAQSQYKVCDTSTLVCRPIEPGPGGVYNAYFDDAVFQGTQPTNTTKAWVSWQDANYGIVYPEIRCTKQGYCGVSSTASSTCPGVIQTVDSSTMGNWTWDPYSPYLPLNTQFLDNHIAEFSARCQQADAGLTVTGDGMQPLFYKLQQTGQATCTPDAFERIPFTTDGPCVVDAQGLTCAGAPRGMYTLTGVNTTHAATTCNITNTGTLSPSGCVIKETTCGWYVGCNGAPVPDLPSSSATFSNSYPGTGLCNVIPALVNDTCIVLNVAGAPCSVAGDVSEQIDTNGAHSFCPFIQGDAVIYGSNTVINTRFNWTNHRRTNKYNWSANVTPGVPPGFTYKGQGCQWECDGEIICSVCRSHNSDFCNRYKSALSYSGQCSADFFFKGLEVLLMRIVLYSAIGAIAIAMCIGAYRACRKRYNKM